MKNNDFEHNFNAKEDNTFSEYKVFKAEEYTPKERCDFSNDFKVDEAFDEDKEKKVDNQKKAINLNKDDSLQKINKIAKTAQNISSTVASHSAIAVTSAVAVVSASVVGFIPSINVISSSSSVSSIVSSSSVSSSVSSSSTPPIPIQKIEIKTDSLINASTLNEIVIKGEILNVNDDYKYYALIDQVKNGEYIEEDGYSELSISNNQFSFSIPAYYGITSFQYDIYYSINKEENVLLYSSTNIDYEISQEYQASYNKVSPLDAKYTFNDDGTIGIQVDTNFETEYDSIFKYGLYVTDLVGNVCAQYLGNDKSIDLLIENPLEEVNNLSFEYYDVGEFNGVIHEYDHYLIDTFSVISIPTFYFNEGYTFIDDKFAISYNLDSVYDSTKASLDLVMTTKTNKVEKHVEDISETGSILLDEFEGEIGEITIEGKLNFQDEILDKYSHSISIPTVTYNMSYSFEITQVLANVIDSSGSIPLTFSFDYQLPSTYEIKFTDEGNLDLTIPLTEEYELSALSSSDGGNISISILNGNEKWGETITYNILSSSEAKSRYIEPTSKTNVGPNNSIVTFNEDGTMNIYRDLEFEATSEETYYDAFIYSGLSDDGLSYNKGIHNISNSRYSIVEDLPAETSSFIYYSLLKVDNIFYYVEENIPPSGAIETATFNYVYTKSSYNSETNKTTVSIYADEGSLIESTCYYNNTEYQLTFSAEDELSTCTVVLDGNAIGETLQVIGSFYCLNYDTIKENLPIKGNLYKTYDLIINEE